MFRASFRLGALRSLLPEHVPSIAKAVVAITILFARVVLDSVSPVQRPILLLQRVGPGAGRKLRIALRDPDLKTILDRSLLNALRGGTGAKTHERPGRDDNLAHVQSPQP